MGPLLRAAAIAQRVPDNVRALEGALAREKSASHDRCGDQAAAERGTSRRQTTVVAQNCHRRESACWHLQMAASATVFE